MENDIYLRKTEPVVLVTAVDIGTLDDTWKDQGSPIDMQGYKGLGIFIELIVNDSTGNQVQVLPIHTSSGTEHVLEVSDLYQKTLGDSNISLYLEFGTDNTIRELQIQTKATDIGIDAALLTGDTGAQATFGTWAAVTDGSFGITIDGTAYNIDAITFAGDGSMADVAATIQTAIRAATSSTETVAWSTNKFIITSVDNSSSAITVTRTSTGTVGTDISGAGAADWMDCDTANGVVTDQAGDEATLIITTTKTY